MKEPDALIGQVRFYWGRGFGRGSVYLLSAWKFSPEGRPKGAQAIRTRAAGPYLLVKNFKGSHKIQHTLFLRIESQVKPAHCSNQKNGLEWVDSIARIHDHRRLIVNAHQNHTKCAFSCKFHI